MTYKLALPHTKQMTPTSKPSMARPRTLSIKLPPHVHCVTARGKPYYYLQRNRGTGKASERIRLPDDPRQPEWWDEYRRLMQLPAPTIKADTFEHVIKVYRDSPDFKELADATRSNYERYLAVILDKWASLEIKGLEPKHVLALRDRYQAKPATANAIVSTLSALMCWAIPRGYRSENPARHIKKLKTGDGWGPWPWEMIELVEKHAPPWMWHAIQPGRHAARGEAADQRVGELVREHAIELADAFERAPHRHPNRAVIRAGRPRRRPRDVAELLGRVQHDRHRRGGNDPRIAPIRQYAQSSEASASPASASSEGPSKETVKCEPIACCMRSCSSHFAPPAIERGAGILVAG